MLMRFSTLLVVAFLIASQIANGQSHSGKVVNPDRPAVTFLELGSVKCVPCRKMQPVMKAIEEKYAGRVRVIFHDVWTDSGRTAAEGYDISLIPTQVFLDAEGKEFFRHEGYFPEEEIHKLLQKQGVTPHVPGVK
jgi:thioredoxin 1